MPDSVNLKDLAVWLGTNTGFTPGDDMQVSFFSQGAPERCTLITNKGGGKVYHEPPRDIRDFMLQVLSRAPNWNEAEDDNYAFFKFLFEDGTSHIALPVGSPTFYIEYIIAIAPPQYLDRDEANRFRYVSNYKLITKKL